MSKLNSHMSDDDRTKELLVKPIGDCLYVVANHGFLKQSVLYDSGI